MAALILKDLMIVSFIAGYGKGVPYRNDFD